MAFSGATSAKTAVRIRFEKPAAAAGIRCQIDARRYSDLFYSFTIGSVGAILFLLVDKYDEGPWPIY